MHAIAILIFIIYFDLLNSRNVMAVAVTAFNDLFVLQFSGYGKTSMYLIINICCNIKYVLATVKTSTSDKN